MIVISEVERTIRAEAITRLLMLWDRLARNGRNIPTANMLEELDKAFAPEKGQRGYITQIASTGPLGACRGGFIFGSPTGLLGCALLGVGQDSGPALIGGWADTRAMNATALGMNTAAYASGVVTARNIARNRRGASTEVVLYGHSGGGVVAECTAHILRNDHAITAAEIQTFGSPKPGNGGSYLTLSSNRRTRWMNAGDPVPGIPFLATGTRGAIALDIAGSRYRPDLCRQPNGGRGLAVDGASDPADEADTPMDATIGNVAAWLAGQDTSGEFPHSLEAYNRRLNARLESGAALMPPSGRAKRPPIPTIITVENPSSPEPTPERQNGRVAVIQGSAATVPPLTRLPWEIGVLDMAGQAKVSKNLKVRRQRSGGIYMVLWDDVIIGTSANSSGANQIAGAMNRLARMMGKSSSISAASFAAYWQMFFGAASQVDGGVKPPINVT